MTANESDVSRLLDRLEREAEQSGYHLNPDREFTRGLVEGLLKNEERYGYWACPCRLAAGIKDQDLDIICPCDYRDPDLDEFGTCYCALYVSREVLEGRRKLAPIMERRPPEGPAGKDRSRVPAAGAAGQHGPLATAEGSAGKVRPRATAAVPGPALSALSHPVWRCRVCGYLCARDAPPEVCPICKAKKDRFQRFL
jgi:ferredoxin-thioredoxin reductase catalytic chain